MLKIIEYKANEIIILDQRKLPAKIKFIRCKDYKTVVRAIEDMAIRGAPAIGVATGFGMALGAKNFNHELTRIPRIKQKKKFLQKLDKIGRDFIRARPTAVNISWAVKKMLATAHTDQDKSIPRLQTLLARQARNIYNENLRADQKIAEYGLKLIRNGATILTHCNTGSLATAGEGTALGIIKSAYQRHKKIKVFVDETRPRLQGARLTAWELKQAGIPFTLICDSAAGHFLQSGKVDLVLVGADRVAANGDTANKIGTYTLSVLARENRTPFYVACPVSTIDLTKKNDAEITIEQRCAREVSYVFKQRVCPEDIDIANPAFDLTPHQYITAIITEKGIIRPPYKKNLRNLNAKCEARNSKQYLNPKFKSPNDVIAND